MAWAIRADLVADSAAMAGERRFAARLNRGPAALGLDGAERLSADVLTFAARVGDVAVVPVYGPLVQRWSPVAWSYQEIGRDLDLALADERIARIVLDVDSPGGMVAGVADLARRIALADRTKPVAAAIAGVGASAAYWIAAAAGEVVAARGSVVGSVGAIIRFLDTTGIWTRMGARVVEAVAASSPAKALDPDSEEGRAELQAIVDAAGRDFVAAVASFRGVGEGEVVERFGGGRVFAAGEALDRGMIDRIGTLADLVAGAADRDGPGTGGVAAAPVGSTEGARMHEDGQAEGGDAAAVEAARAEGVAGERARVLAILEAAAPGDLGAAVEAVREGREPAAALAAFLANARRAVSPAADGGANAAALNGMRAADRAAAGAAVEPVVPLAGADGPAGAEPAATASDDELRAAWERSPRLRGEFPTAGAYAAFRRAEARAAG